MTAHWNHRENWLHGSSGESLCEIWDGRRFADFSWFWDPTKQWLLPVRCNVCEEVVSGDVISLALTSTHNLDEVQVEWPHCYSQFRHCPQYVAGDPRNIALIGHWDGWQPFSTTAKHSCGKWFILCVGMMCVCHVKKSKKTGSIEVKIATMTKLDRSKTEEVYVCSFVPSYSLPNKMPWSLDPFLCPLIRDIKNAFINGMV